MKERKKNYLIALGGKNYKVRIHVDNFKKFENNRVYYKRIEDLEVIYINAKFSLGGLAKENGSFYADEIIPE